MSKKAKKASKEKNLQRKRAMRAANKARYQTMAQAGQNSKSKRFRAKSKLMRKIKMVDHADGHCGNYACDKCFPDKHLPTVTGKKKYAMG